MDIEKIIKRNGGDLETYRQKMAIRELPFGTVQGIYASVGRSVIQDLIDGTTPTAELIKRHFEAAQRHYREGV